jgi:hypothetical protein
MLWLQTAHRFPRFAGGGDWGLGRILCSGGGEYLWGALCLARNDLVDDAAWGGEGGLWLLRVIGLDKEVGDTALWPRVSGRVGGVTGRMGGGEGGFVGEW